METTLSSALASMVAQLAMPRQYADIMLTAQLSLNEQAPVSVVHLIDK